MAQCPSRFFLFIIFLVANQQERGEIISKPRVYDVYPRKHQHNIILAFELPTLNVTSEEIGFPKGAISGENVAKMN